MDYVGGGNVVHSGVDGIGNLSAKQCSQCHYDIYKQWKGSMHAQSTALKDSIHGLFYGMVVGSPLDEGVRTGKDKNKYPICLECHSPAAAKEGKAKLGAKVSFSEGVNCVACHSLTKFKGTSKKGGGLQLGVKAYEYSSTQCSKTHPMKGDKQAMFMYIIGDDNNKPAPPPKATKVLGDTRLKPNETRVLNYQISVMGVTKVVAKAYYDLLLVPMKKKFKSKLPRRLLAPKEIAKAVVFIK